MLRRRPLLSTLLLLGVLGAGLAALQLHHANAWMMLARRDAAPLARLPDLIRDRRIVILGERHALVEPLDTVRLLLFDPTQAGAFTHVALEWPASDQPDLDRFMAGDDRVLDLFRQKYGQLPGATEDYWALLSQIRENNRKQPKRAVKVCLVDVPSPVRNTAEEERDLHMFSGIERAIEADRQNRVLVYAGAGHAGKAGSINYKTKEGRLVLQQIFGARLHERYGEEVVSIKILSPDDPMWVKTKNQTLFTDPVVIPLTSEWPNPTGLFYFWQSHPDASGRAGTADAVFDYVVWWPTSRSGRKTL